MRSSDSTVAALSLLSLLASASARGQDDVMRLEIGAEARAGAEVAVGLDTVVATDDGREVSPDDLANALGERRLVVVGEQHTDAEFHAVQLRVLERLRAAGVPIAIGVEMLPADSQDVLDAWTRGALSERQFVDATDWYRVWGYPWGYYRAVFEFAREHSVPVIGLGGSGEDEAGSAPPADLESDDHRRLLRAFFASDSPVHGDLDAEQFEDLFVAQARRDAAMARRAVAALERYPDRTLVLLAGIGHALYGLGIVRQLPERYRVSAATVVPVPVEPDRDAASVSAAVADFVWGVPERRYPAHPELGIVTLEVDAGLHVIYVESGSPAASAGVEAGDVLTGIGGTPLAAKADLGRAIGEAAWGDVVVLSLSRAGEPREIAVALRR